jgi:hypothetical protein
MDINVPAGKRAFFYIKQITGLLLLLALSATFFYSAYTKSGVEFHNFHIYSNDNAFDSFQWTFLDLGINSIIATGIIARMLIGLELLLGLFLLCHIYLRQFTFPAVIGVLSVFIIYLVIVLVKQGNTGNCGCFGNSVEMTPIAAILKNLAMIAATILLWFIYPPKRSIAATNDDLLQGRILNLSQYVPFVAIFIATIAFSIPFIVNNIFVSTDPEKYTKNVNFDLLYQYDTAPQVELRKGKHIIAFMSLTCPHCKKAAYLLQIIHHEHPDIPVFMVLDGPKAYQQKFFDETHAEDVPHMLYYGHTDDFMKMAGSGVPSIYWVSNGIIQYKSTYAYYQLDPVFMEKWMKQAN